MQGRKQALRHDGVEQRLQIGGHKTCLRADFDGDDVRLVETKGNQSYKNVLWRKRR